MYTEEYRNKTNLYMAKTFGTTHIVALTESLIILESIYYIGCDSNGGICRYNK